MNKLRSSSFAYRPVLAVGSTALAALIATTPHTKADAATCDERYTLTAGTVTDKDTLLTWQRAADTTLNWDQAKTYCQNLSLPEAEAGWRLPEIFELQTIVDESVTAPALDSKAFSSSMNQNGVYWSVTQNMDDKSRVWAVDFGISSFPGGYLKNDSKTSLNRVRCVRTEL